MGRIWRSLKIITGLFCAMPTAVVAMPAAVVVIALTQLVGNNTSAQAAETVVVRFGLFAESIPVADLQTAAETGKFPESLNSYTKHLTQSQQALILGALRTNLSMNVVTVSRLLNTEIGIALLNNMSTALVRQDTAGVQALRAGFVLGSNAPKGLSILSFIDAYPSKNLEINLPEAFTVAKNLNAGFWLTQQFMLAISPLLNPAKPQISFSFDPSQPGSAQVQVMKLTWNDQKRQRQIPVDIYWSTAVTADKPVIVYSHGYSSVRTDLNYLAQHLASHGYVFVALEHPGSDQTYVDLAIKNNTPLLKAQEFLDRPRDISFVLDELAKLNQTANNPLQGKLATNNAMVIGYSFGGSTALEIAGAELQLEGLKKRCKEKVSEFSLGETLQCVAQDLPENRYQLGDSRIKRAMFFSPTSSLLFGETGFSKIQVPSLMLTGSADKTVPALSDQIVPFTKIPSPKWLVGILGGTHLSVKDPNYTLDQIGKANTPFYGGEVFGDQAAEIRKYVKAITLAFAAQMTPEASKYATFLTPDYAEFASTQAIPIRLVTEIPPEALAIVKKFVGN